MNWTISLFILTKQKLSNFRTIKTIKEINKLDPHYIVICNPTSDHINKIRFIEKTTGLEGLRAKLVKFLRLYMVLVMKMLLFHRF